MKGNIDNAILLANRYKVGQQLKQAREKKGLSQRELADMLGIRQPTVTSIENGEWAASLDKLFLFCHFLEIKTIEL
ncbi:helix-turn-helix transcriptional regulator [Pontibacter qinzhouensis]|uniref:Helix-turn-helix transcriptional regulator n=1 Tax=Pontibacter qinzhouensis TaxID=2603253 RepID=A0A5C8KDA4_9BACT|nr:helix-turn-helix transcriptional regulator [Pontibacter qinzhouensis]TXK52408.1 helix-turn-helix transcriptional regulator [Pontibacter qinzhouensis]